MQAEKYVVLTNSASKRALFPSNRRDDGDKDSLGHMSPLSMSSPDRYSSPPPSPQWLAESPLKIQALNEEVTMPRFSRYDTWKQSCSEFTPLKSNQSSGGRRLPRIACNNLQDSENIQETVRCMDMVDETPEKNTQIKGLMTPFRCLSGKENSVMETPDASSVRKTIFTPSKDFGKKNKNSHSSDIKKCMGVKPKPKLDLDKAFKPIPEIPQTSFYKSVPKARATLFPEKSSAKASSSTTVIRKRTRSPSVVSTRIHSHGRYLKRRKAGEINSGVCHKIKRPKKKKELVKVPVMTPQERVKEYVLKNLTEAMEVEESSSVPEMAVRKVTNESTPKKAGPVPKSLPSPVVDPSKKFFKTNRTLAINRKATVSVVDCMKIKVSNGKFTLENSSKKPRKVSTPNVVAQENRNKDVFEDIVVEPVLDTVKESVESILESLDVEEPQCVPNIACITSSTSCLAINDGVPPEASVVEGGNSAEAATPEDEAESKKLYPLFYKNVHGTPNSERKAPTPRRPSRKWKPIGNDQYQIDAGQKRFGVTQCKECGIVYQLGDPEDEISHYNFHTNAKSLKFTGWADERVIRVYPTGKVLVVYPLDSKHKLKKVRDVLEVVDHELGFVDPNFKYMDTSKVYLYVKNKRVLGCLVAEPKSESYQMLSAGLEGVDCCSTEAYPIKCGVSRIWTVQDGRRSKIATRMMDCLRLSFMFAHVLDKNEIAFSVPTIEGKAFAEKYMDTPNFLVYT